MKNIMTMLCCLACLAWTASCGDDPLSDDSILPTEENNGGSGNAGEDGNGNGTAPEEAAGRILIVYFSRAGENWNVGYVERGNTAIMGDYIQEFTGGDVFEIVPQTPYPDDYDTMLEMCRQEVDNDARPAIRTALENLDDYSVVFIGSPIWYGRPPMIMRTFYESYPGLADKTIVPFGTHGGSGISSCTSLLREYFPDAALLESLGIAGDQIRNGQSRTNVQSWLLRIGILQD